MYRIASGIVAALTRSACVVGSGILDIENGNEALAATNEDTAVTKISFGPEIGFFRGTGSASRSQ